MIITIKGADFSLANIGTLNTVTIRKIIGRGLTHNIPNFISKGVAANWTLTLSEDYELNEYTITMGGEVITPTVSEGVMAINIPSITGSISINITTTYVGVAEPEQPDMPDTPTPEEPEQPDDMVDVQLFMNNYNSSISVKGLGNAYVANMKQIIPANKNIKYLDLVINERKDVVIEGVSVWVFDAETNTMIEKLVDNRSIQSVASDFANVHVLRIAVDKEWDKPVYFGYTCIKNVNTSIAYYSEEGNYLSGAEFTPDTVLSPTANSVTCCVMIFEESQYNLLYTFNNSGVQSVASDCWVANTNDVIAANTRINKIEVAGKGNINGFNVAVINADTLTLVEYLVNEENKATSNSIFSADSVVTVDVDKVYDFPVLLMFNSERTATNVDTIYMLDTKQDGAGILYVDSKEGTIGSPEVGYAFTATSKYAINHKVYTLKN